MKKCIILLLLLNIFIPTGVFADSSRSSVVMDVDSGRILYSNNMNSKMLIASTTKIMTCIVTLENVDLNKEILVGDEILEIYGTNIYLEVGEKIKVKDLLYGLMLRSGNDAAEVLAKNVFKNRDEFIKMMNNKAKQIGMDNTIFNNPHGLDDNTMNYSTAYDMALLSRYAYHNKEYCKIVATKKYVTKSNKKTYVWYNRMNLLGQYKYCIGGKNGYTPKAGKSLVSYAKKNDLVLTVVTLDDNDIYNNHEYLYNYYFDKYKSYIIIDKNNFSIDSNFITDKVYLKNSFRYPLTKEECSDISTFIKVSNERVDNVVGEISIKLRNDEIGKLNIYKQEEKKEDKSIFAKFKKLFT